MSALLDLSIPIDQARKVDWRAGLIKDRNDKPRAELLNAAHALAHAPEMTGVLASDEFARRVITLRASPWRPDTGPWTPHDDLAATEWLQQNQIYTSLEVAGQAVQLVASRRPVHPVRDYLANLAWDGDGRIDTWLSDFVGAEPSEYVAAVGGRWLISAVARIMQPGCKVDTCLIFEGAQGIGKSRAFKALAGEWFTDTIPDLRSKDAALQLSGVWIVELAELDTLSRSEAATVKAFMSRTSDRYRPPYGKRAEDAPRQCVFGGSVNHDDYLRDDTGGRRFWPVRCGARIDVDGLARERDQLFAEAVDRYRCGVAWWLDRPDLDAAARDEQAARLVEDPWRAVIESYVVDRVDVTTEDVLSDAIRKPRSDCGKADQQRVGAILRACGFARRKVRTGARTVWQWERSE